MNGNFGGVEEHAFWMMALDAGDECCWEVGTAEEGGAV